MAVWFWLSLGATYFSLGLKITEQSKCNVIKTSLLKTKWHGPSEEYRKQHLMSVLHSLLKEKGVAGLWPK